MGTLARLHEATGKSAHPTIAASITRTLAAGLVFALTVAAFLAPFASHYEDGLAAVLSQFHLTEFNLTARVPGLFADYDQVPVPIAGWPALAVSIAGVGGTLAVFGLALLLGKSLPVQASAPANQPERASVRLATCTTSEATGE